MKLTIDQKIALREVLKTKLSMGVSEVVFEKADGTIRTMAASRDKAVVVTMIGEAEYDKYVKPVKARKESTDMVPCFDVTKQAWRGFSIDKLISVNGMKVDHLLQFIG